MKRHTKVAEVHNKTPSHVHKLIPAPSSQYFSRRLINIPSPWRCLNYQHPTLLHSLMLPDVVFQFNYSHCACGRSINQAIHFRISGSFIYQLNDWSFINAAVATRAAHRMRPLFQRENAIDYFWGDTHVALTFHSACFFGSGLIIKTKKFILLTFAFLVGIYILLRNLPACKCQM